MGIVAWQQLLGDGADVFRIVAFRRFRNEAAEIDAEREPVAKLFVAQMLLPIGDDVAAFLQIGLAEKSSHCANDEERCQRAQRQLPAHTTQAAAPELKANAEDESSLDRGGGPLRREREHIIRDDIRGGACGNDIQRHKRRAAK